MLKKLKKPKIWLLASVFLFLITLGHRIFVDSGSHDIEGVLVAIASLFLAIALFLWSVVLLE